MKATEERARELIARKSLTEHVLAQGLTEAVRDARDWIVRSTMEYAKTVGDPKIKSGVELAASSIRNMLVLGPVRKTIEQQEISKKGDEHDSN